MRPKTNLYVLKLSFFSFCLVTTLVSITQVSAEGNNTVSTSSSATASVTVSSACSFSRTNGSGEYNGVLANNSSVEIPASTFTTFCNDPGGYAIYAIGYSNNEYGNTDLIYNNEPTSTHNIKTDGDTLVGGNGSSWEMKLSSVENSFTPTIENNYNNYSNIPSNYTKIASYNNVTINDSDDTTGSSITATYQATASGTQPAGAYTGQVKYTMVHPGTTPAAYFMQDVADWADELPNPGDAFQAVDRRDGKVYWVARLADGNIWMTQNLDLDIDETKTYTHYDTDLGYTTNDPTATWQPAEGHSTIFWDSITNKFPGWRNSKIEPYSANPGDVYYYTSNSDVNDIRYGSLQDCQAAGHTNCEHYHAGNYYNWPTSIASNNTSSVPRGEVSTSICPAGWRLPSSSAKEIGILLADNNVISDISVSSGNLYVENGFNNIRINPLYLVRSGSTDGILRNASETGWYWSSTNTNGEAAGGFVFKNDNINLTTYSYKQYGASIRCLARTED